MLNQANPLTRLVDAVFQRRGCPEDEAGRIATFLVGANLAGHDSHGVIRVPRYVQYIDDGKITPGGDIKVVTRSESFVLVDGCFGFGQTVGPKAARLGMDMALEKGVGVVALRNAGHLGRIGDYPLRAAVEGLVSVHFVNVAGSCLVAPFGGIERRFSTAPFAVGVPSADGPPIILDFATSVVAEGKALVAYNGGKALPGNSLVGPEGEISGDPLLLYGADASGGAPSPRNGPGALRAMGDHKGSGLALMCELLAGAFTGSGCAGPEPRQVANGMLSFYFSVQAFDDGHGVGAMVRDYVAFVKSSRPVDAGGEVLVPGEPERRREAERRRDGIPLTDAAWAAILETARGVGIEQPEIDSILGANA